MSDKAADAVIKRVLAKKCEENEDACPLIHAYANNKYPEEEMWGEIQKVIPEGPEGYCSQEFERLKDLIMQDDEIIANQDSNEQVA